MKAATIGECMIELSRRPGGQYAMAHGGDSLNTAVYLARLGVDVDYVTALGNDPYSAAMLAAWQAEGVGTGQVRQLAGRLPGIYVIETDDRGERQFFYWRDRAPARDLFALPETPDICAALAGYGLIYLTGVSLSLYGEAGREKLFGTLSTARRRGGLIAFDSNFRPRNWPDPEEARAAFRSALALADIALCGADDFRALFGSEQPPLDICRKAGVAEIVVKDGAEPALVVLGGRETVVPIESPRQPVDTTAAGDSFAAAYLAARLAGAVPEAAALNGHRLAGAVIMHPGAIMSGRAMPDGLIRLRIDEGKDAS
ncbi:MAG: sugar kinase [Alphaproteobacteria bacterium]|nr:sugar kinase [Alphaproteobacteria bacterium]